MTDKKRISAWRRAVLIGFSGMFLFAGAALPAQAIDVVDQASQCNVNGFWRKICQQRVLGHCVSTRTYWYQCQMKSGGAWYGGTHLPKIIL